MLYVYIFNKFILNINNIINILKEHNQKFYSLVLEINRSK